MAISPYFKITLPTILSIALAGCGGSSDSNSNGYIQFYNGSVDSPSTTLFIEEIQRTGAEFGQVSTRHSYEPATYEVSYEYFDDNNEYISLFKNDVQISSDHKKLIIMTGPFEDPKFTEFDIENKDTSIDDDNFSISFINTLSEEQNYNVYMGEDNSGFANAQLLGNSEYLKQTELKDLLEGTYTFYITKSDSEIIEFQSSEISIGDGYNIVAVLRESYGASEQSISLDLISDNNTVLALKHTESIGQVHFYNAINEYDNVTFSATHSETSLITQVTPSDSFSNYLTLQPGDYSISMSENDTVLVDNYLLTIEKEQSLAAIFYKNHEVEEPRMLSVTEKLIPNSVTHQIKVVNLIDTSPTGQPLDEIEIYWTKGDENISDTNTYIKNLDQYDSKSVDVDDDIYTLQVIYEENGENFILLQQTNMTFNQDGNYIMILEEDDETGYKITMEHNIAE